MSEEFIQGFIIAHAVLGSLGLLTGLVALIVKKGGLVHRRFGRIFYYSMLGAAASALITWCSEFVMTQMDLKFAVFVSLNDWCQLCLCTSVIPFLEY